MGRRGQPAACKAFIIPDRGSATVANGRGDTTAHQTKEQGHDAGLNGSTELRAPEMVFKLLIPAHRAPLLPHLHLPHHIIVARLFMPPALGNLGTLLPDAVDEPIVKTALLMTMTGTVGAGGLRQGRPSIHEGRRLLEVQQRRCRPP